jgi:hypothetical protein
MGFHTRTDAALSRTYSYLINFHDQHIVTLFRLGFRCCCIAASIWGLNICADSRSIKCGRIC